MQKDPKILATSLSLPITDQVKLRQKVDSKKWIDLFVCLLAGKKSFVIKSLTGRRERADWPAPAPKHRKVRRHCKKSENTKDYQNTRSSWLNCALRDDEAVYWVSIGHNEAAAVGNWWYWVSRGHSCLYILQKVEIWRGVTDAWLTDRQLWKIELLSSL